MTSARLPSPEAEIPGHLILKWPDPEDAELADWEPADWEPADREPADWEPGDGELVDWAPGDGELADWEPADPRLPEAAGREVLKAGRWDRARGDGMGFAAGGVADAMPPGPALAGFAADAWAAGLGRLSDDELIGVMRAARRLSSWTAAMELAAVGDLWRRRVAEGEAGDTDATCHADDEVAAALTLTGRAADRVLDLAIALRRLPLTSQALAAGDIDLPRAMVIADEVTGLDGEHAAAVERAITGSATGQTTGQLRAAARRAVMAADPSSARRRKERAQQDARVERWDEHAGTAALAGRDLPPASVLAADQNLTALARQLKAAGIPGTMDTLRARAFLALLSGTPMGSLLPGGLSAPRESANNRGPTGPAIRGDSATAGFPGGGFPGGGFLGAGFPGAGFPGAEPGVSAAPGFPGPFGTAGTAGQFPASTGTDQPPGLTGTVGQSPGLTGTVNLTMPLATWLGCADAPGHAAGYGPLDADDSRALARVLAGRADSKWCITFTGAGGRPVAHGCIRAGAVIPGPRSHGPPSTGPPGTDHTGPAARSPDMTWVLTVTPLPSGSCDHAKETPAYPPSRDLRHLLEIRHATCTYPGCRRPAAQCDADHTLAYHRGGRTCLCNLGPVCRRHHKVKQSPGWTLHQVSPGVMTWTTPAGRRYTVGPSQYPA
jgi:hypothetical protein